VTSHHRMFIGVLTISALMFSGLRASAQTETSVVSAAAVAPPSAVDSAPPIVASAAPSTAAPKRTLVITGKGFGHGRGLSQWGAYGYAQKGWTSRQILDHYYGGTVPGGLSPTSAIGVRISNLDAKPLTLFQPKGHLYLRLDAGPGLIVPPALAAQAPTPSTAPSVEPVVAAGAAPTPAPEITSTTGLANGAIVDPPLANGPAAAIRIRLANGAWEVSDAPTCAGPWTVRSALTNRSVTVVTGPWDPAANADDPDTMLHLCEAKQRRVYRGDFLATTDGNVQRSVNLVAMEAYLRGVVPREISASWGDKGIEAVKAQAVAARSYASAEKRSGFANTCDTISCQVYGGRGVANAKAFTSLEDPRTDRAVAETVGEIRVNPKTGAAVRTEFSASSGGHTAGGEFPAVPDEGDAIAANPNHLWERRIPGASVGKSNKLGALIDAKVTEQDGNGPDGGRAKKVLLTYERGSVTIKADEFMRSFSLKSTYFTAAVFTDVPPTIAPLQSVTDAGTGQALTGDAGGPVPVAGAIPEGALGSTPGTTIAPAPTDTTAPSATKPKATKPPVTKKPKRNPNTTVVNVAVPVGASPVVTVSGGAVVGTPTTVKAATAKATKAKKRKG
jgi:SpoIID/LytB domain protein